MTVFARITAAAAAAALLRFLLRSRFAVQDPPPAHRAVCLGGCWVLLCIGGHWAVELLAAPLAAWGMARFWGQARLWPAAFFTGLFTALYAAAWGISLCIGAFFPQVDGATALLVRAAALYATAVAAAFLGRLWRPAARPMLQLIPVWLTSVLLCAVCVYQSGVRGLGLVQCMACLWTVYSALALYPAENRVEAQLCTIQARLDLAHQYALQEEYYSQLKEKQTETRALWHDLNKYLLAAQAETASSDALARLKAMVDESMEIVDVGNPVLNVILNEYARTAKAQQIELRLRVQVPETLRIAAADLSVLIGNSMDNAITACRALPLHQRFIELTLRTQYDILFYQVVNPFGPQTQEVSHGYGLPNIRRCVERYGGNVDVSRDQGFFILRAHLNQPPEE